MTRKYEVVRERSNDLCADFGGSHQTLALRLCRVRR